MSRIIINLPFEGQVLSVAVGFDRPTKGCFLSPNIHVLDWPDDADDLDDAGDDAVEVPLPPKWQTLLDLSSFGLGRQLSSEDVLQALKRADLEAPTWVAKELLDHELRNVGNLIVQFDEQGQRTVLHQDD